MIKYVFGDSNKVMMVLFSGPTLNLLIPTLTKSYNEFNKSYLHVIKVNFFMIGIYPTGSQFKL